MTWKKHPHYPLELTKEGRIRYDERVNPKFFSLGTKWKLEKDIPHKYAATGTVFIYLAIDVKKTQIKGVAKLMLETFIGRHQWMKFAGYRDLNSLNIHLDNLLWVASTKQIRNANGREMETSPPVQNT